MTAPTQYLRNSHTMLSTMEYFRTLQTLNGPHPDKADQHIDSKIITASLRNAALDERLRICDDEEIQLQIDARINTRHQRTAFIIAILSCGGSMWRGHHSQPLGDVHASGVGGFGTCSGISYIRSSCTTDCKFCLKYSESGCATKITSTEKLTSNNVQARVDNLNLVTELNIAVCHNITTATVPIPSNKPRNGLPSPYLEQPPVNTVPL
jgi:hypothetical protein